MSRIPVDVVDGSDSDVPSVHAEPEFITDAKLNDVFEQLLSREPLFHREAQGLARKDFEALTDSSFWETGASGKRYSRQCVIDTLVNRYKNVVHETWYIEDFQCREISSDNYLVTYTLFQSQRKSRRSTIWHHRNSRWKIFYHQGTLVS